MTQWTDDLSMALESGDPRFMKAMLGRVPPEVLKLAAPAIAHLARTSEEAGRLGEALSYRDSLVDAAPGETGPLAARASLFAKLDRYSEALADGERIARLAPDEALGYRVQAQAWAGLGERTRELAAWRRVAGFEPGDEALGQRIAAIESAIAREQAPPQEAQPGASHAAAPAEAPMPRVAFDPALLGDPSMPSSFDAYRVDGLKRHLWRYSGQLAPRNAIARLEDPYWLAAWDRALAGTREGRVLFAGSELGLFALRALGHGAAHALCAEDYPSAARVASGLARKHFLAGWRALHGNAIAQWSEEERGASFAQFSSAFDVVEAGATAAAGPGYDYLVFPGLDHTLLGTGIVKAVRAHRIGESMAARVMPAKASVYAMGIGWNYPDSQLQLEPLNELRWSLYPQALEAGSEFWTALTEPQRVAEIDFSGFEEKVVELALPVTAGGTIDAIVFWYELDLGGATISTAPGSQLRVIRPAVQYTDPIPVQAGSVLEVRLQIEETRLFFQAQPPAWRERTGRMPGWRLAMLEDRRRNEAYREVLGKAFSDGAAGLVLDIGAGYGLLSMAAAQAGAGQVVGCESDPAVAAAARALFAANGLGERISLVGTDCRKLRIPEDMPRKADMALFELFDCSLIGEGILHFLAHAREELLTEDARYLPRTAKIRAMIVEYRIERVFDIDASLLNPLRASPCFVNVDAAGLDYRALTEPFDVFAFDFATAGPTPQQAVLRVAVREPGVASAVLFWFDLGLDADTWISNAPRGDNAPHWKQGLQFLREVQVGEGVELVLAASHDGNALAFRWDLDALPADAVSKVPVCDPRALAANAELEQQTQALMQHCAANPVEFAQVAEIAKRFAVDPGRHGLDPVIAQRFAEMLFRA